MYHEKCTVCKIHLHPEDDTHDQDEAYNIDGNVLCDGCVEGFVKENYKMKLQFEDVPDDYGTHKELYGKGE